MTRSVGQYGERSVFYDLASVEGGANFADVIEKAVTESTVVLAIVGDGGTGWLPSGDGRGLIELLAAAARFARRPRR